MQNFTPNTEKNSDLTPKNDIPAPPSNTPPPPADVDTDPSLDEFGYKKDAPSEIPPPPGVAKVDDKPIEEGKKVTGYGKKVEGEIPPPPAAPSEVPPPKKEETPPPPAEPTKKEGEETPPVEDAEKTKAELSEVIKDLPDVLSKDKVLKFALDNKLTKDQLTAYKALVADDLAASAKAQEEAVKAQRTAWESELKKDPTFGGEHFDLNVDRAEKVLENYMPGMKKALTERGSVLPPYIMKDLADLYKVLNPTAPLVLGETGEADKKEDNFLNDLYQ